MTPLVIIPARKGSVRVPRKNVRRVYGQSLLERAIDIGTQIGDVVVTTDDPVAKAQAARKNVEVLNRPPRLATRTASMSDVIRHAMYHGYTQWVLLQPTTPTRTVDEVRRVIAAGRHVVAASVTRVEAHGLVVRDVLLQMRGDFAYPLRLGSAWRKNGAAYAGPMDDDTDTNILRVVESPTPHINVDTPADWKAWVALRKREVGR